jgi:Mn2+/Fe2+ NRAMP family transporter
MGFSNLVALFIMITAAATLHVHGITSITSSAQAAEALRPIAGPFTFALFAMGIIGTGFLAVPVLAASAAYALGEARSWTIGLSRKPSEAKAFYATIAVSTLLGICINFSAIDPVAALFWSAVINGMIAVPIMAIMMLLAAKPAVMGGFVISGTLKLVGWIATLAMALASIAMLLSWAS